MGDDGKKLYDPCLHSPDNRNPIACGHARVGALICMDAWDGQRDLQDRRHHLLADLNNGDGHKILCVPAWPTTNMPDPTDFLPTISDYWYVLAS